jgi:hypothetical protein
VGFNNTAGTVVSWSDTQVVATVAAGTNPGNAWVTQNGTRSNYVAFTMVPIYDAGTLDAADGSFAVHFERPAGAPLQLRSAVIYQLPRLASIDSLNGNQRPFTFNKEPIRPWSATKCAPQTIERRARCVVANIKNRPHVLSVHKVGEPQRVRL